jgi:transposase, IS5 family
MRTNKVNNVDLFTHQANENFKKHIKTQSKQALEIIGKSINWEALLKPIEQAINKLRSNEPAGRPRYSLLTIVKCFILQYTYDLSDPRLEEEIADRRSFQMFLDINSGDSIPDETTICRYRELFARLGLDKKLFIAFNKQLERRNILLERVTLVDATIKQSQAKPQSKRDKDATFTQKRGKTYYGYKGHVGVDYGSGAIHSVEFTPANVHDSAKFEQVISGKEKSVYADKGYASKQRKEKLEADGVFCGILNKGYRNKPLSTEQVAKNKQLSAIRNAVERPFAFMKKVLNYDRCRYYDFARNQFQFIMSAFVYNIRKLITYNTAASMG